MIRPLTHDDDLKEAAKLVHEAFRDSYDENEALREIETLLEKDNICLAAFTGGTLTGVIGAMPQYGKTGWELHPLVVAEGYRKQGIGKALIRALETALIEIGAIILYLGTDDETFRTSLSRGDLFDNLFEKLKQIENYSDHPYSFYQKQGFEIVGALPDVNGFNKPDILMAKRLIPYEEVLKDG